MTRAVHLLRRLVLLVLPCVAACDGGDVATVVDGDARGTPFRAVADAEPPREPPPAAPAPTLPEPAPAPPQARAPTGPAEIVTLEVLSDYPYEPPRLKLDAEGKPVPVKLDVDPVPKSIRDLSGKRISVEGYIVPFDYADGTCTKFAVSMSRQYCCFGCTNRLNTYVEVEMAPGRRADCETSERVRVEGILIVHRLEEEISALYTMVCDTATPVE